jgi:hypothetical protein
MLTATLLKYPTDFSSFTLAYTERSLTIKHDIQAERQISGCMYSISVLVLDSVTKKAISDSLVEFQTSLNNVFINKTDRNGATEISLLLDQEPGRTCMEILFSQGYSIEASKIGYAGYGIGRVS